MNERSFPRFRLKNASFYLVVSLDSKNSIMGKYANNRLVNTLGWVTAITMAIVAVASIVVRFT